MSRFYALAGLLLLLTLGACSKDLEDRLEGKWQLVEATRRLQTGTSAFNPGFGDGIFQLNSDGSATYIEETDTLTGFWKADKHTKGFYNNAEGTWQSRGMRFLQINVTNTTIHRSLDLKFDDLYFHHDRSAFRAEQYNLGFDRYYEFRRR